ncbi:hypothetical protein PR003_g25808 [Phytophthora rubi]|uniref:Uncharacterized protein n=1 Tax=Phytophthora rubi TaxID=129364 RepID=A0A6A3I9B6_9STRA|nr:hypothetical protein PR002_g25025 [Phytophthora rubi]KAE9288426.1 hypothetical protein PR003_g25808 [Phytophthora rubi]
MLQPPRSRIHGVLSLLLLLAFWAAPRRNECDDKPAVTQKPVLAHSPTHFCKSRLTYACVPGTAIRLGGCAAVGSSEPIVVSGCPSRRAATSSASGLCDGGHTHRSLEEA